jgi:hypothetical protein
MKYENTFYQLYKKNYYSQNGEDGVLNELISRLNLKPEWVCEFGAGNGIRFSNTLNLINQGYKGVYIESDEKEFKELVNNHQNNENLILLQRTVSADYGDVNSLDSILSSTPITKEFTVLSIDIDSYDYHIWESFKNYRPIIVIIEINSSVDPTNEKYIHNGKDKIGTSFMPMYKLGKHKGYSLVCHTGNMIFLRDDYYQKSGIPKPSQPLANFRREWVNKQINNKIENI